MWKAVTYAVSVFTWDTWHSVEERCHDSRELLFDVTVCIEMTFTCPIKFRFPPSGEEINQGKDENYWFSVLPSRYGTRGKGSLILAQPKVKSWELTHCIGYKQVPEQENHTLYVNKAATIKWKHGRTGMIWTSAMTMDSFFWQRIN